MSRAVGIAGGGPAGSAAALAALAEGAAVTVYEQSPFPRHKVCGEFLSPEVFPLLERLGVADPFLALQPPRIGRVRLHFGAHTKSWRLAEPAFGLSRYALDRMLLDAAAARGAAVRREPAPTAGDATARVTAYGRKVAAQKGSRLFGFKAHFQGSFDDGVDLCFFDRCYAGVSRVEGGEINVCGLAPEAVLHRHGFQPDGLIEAAPVLKDIVRSLTRAMDWLVTGPLVFRQDFDHPAGSYLAGDALGFVDPFTGSGILGALLTGRMAGMAAARGIPAADHLRECRRALRFQYRTAGLFRRLVESGWASPLARLAPGRALFELTRPRVRA